MLQLLDEWPSIRNVILLAGLWCLLSVTVWLIRSLWSGTKAYVFTKLFPSLYRKRTGGLLAKGGVNVVLVSRSMDKLKSVEKEILDQYDVMVKIIAVDFAAGPSIYDSIRMQLSGLEIGILINNVGVTYEFPNYFANISDDMLWQLINVNMASTVMMTKMILPDMLHRKRGIVVNMSSMCALFPLPLLAVYSATKIFLDSFSTALRYEYSNTGVIIQNILPCYVATKMTKIKRPNYFAPSPLDYAQDAVATIGIQDITYGTLSHAIQTFVMLVAPQWLCQLVAFHHLNNTRKRSLNKRDRRKQSYSN